MQFSVLHVGFVRVFYRYVRMYILRGLNKHNTIYKAANILQNSVSQPSGRERFSWNLSF